MSHPRLALFCAALIICQQVPANAQKSTARVSVANVQKRTVSAGQTLIGTVKPVRRSTVGSAVDARVEKVFVNAGDAIKRDQPLVQLRTGTLEIELRAAQAELAVRTAELQELKNGALPEEIKASESQLAAADAILKSRKSRFERTRDLYDKQAITDEQLDEARSGFDEARANHAAMQARHALLKNGARPEQIARAEAQRLFQAEQVKLIEDRIKRHTIRAPYDGFVSAENTEVGEWVQRGDAVLEVVELATVEVEVFLLEKHLRHLQLNSQVRVEVPALPNKVFSGTLQSLVPQADTRSRSFPLHVRIDNQKTDAGPLLRAGMLARVSMPVGQERETLLVPKDALVLGIREVVIFAMKSKGGTAHVQRIPVTLGVMNGGLIEVLTTKLRANDQVVVRGNERLKDGQEVVNTPIPGRKKPSADSKPARTIQKQTMVVP